MEGEIEQFLQPLGRARHALECGAEGQGDNALQHARAELKDIQQQMDDERLNAAMAVMAEAEEAAVDGRCALAQERLTDIERILQPR